VLAKQVAGVWLVVMLRVVAAALACNCTGRGVFAGIGHHGCSPVHILNVATGGSHTAIICSGKAACSREICHLPDPCCPRLPPALLLSCRPVFVYSAPVTVFAAALLTVTGFAAEAHSIVGPDCHGIFGWAASKRYAPVVVYLGAVPGVVGHQGLNTVLRYVSPLMVSLAVQFEPVVGPFIGWATGVSPAPGFFTYIGGGIIMVATVGATVAGALRQQKEERFVKTKSMRMTADDAGRFEVAVDGLAAGDVAGAAAVGQAPSGPASYQQCSADEHDSSSLHHDAGHYMQRHRHGHGHAAQLQSLQLQGSQGDLYGAGGGSERDQLLPHGADSMCSPFEGAAASSAVFTLDDDGVEHAVLTAGGHAAGGRRSSIDRIKQHHEIELQKQ
jgi:hypothetical protein